MKIAKTYIFEDLMIYYNQINLFLIYQLKSIDAETHLNVPQMMKLMNGYMINLSRYNTLEALLILSHLINKLDMKKSS